MKYLNFTNLNNSLLIKIKITISFVFYLSFIYAQSGSFGSTFVHTGAEMGIYGQHHFINGSGTISAGIIGTERNVPIGAYSFVGNSSWIGAANNAFVDGYVKSYLTSAFTFPIGDNGVFRPAKISSASSSAPTWAAYFGINPTSAVTSSLKGGNEPVLPSGGPFASSSKESAVTTVSTWEYWDINGTQSTNISLSWDAASNVNTITSGNLSTLTIVGWDGSKWVAIPSSVDGTSFFGATSTLTSGSITTTTSIVPNVYNVYTLASKCGNVIASISPATATICSGASLNLTASGGTTYLWSNGSTTSTVSVAPASTSTYTVTVTGSGGCTSTASRVVTVNSSPVAAISPATATICSGTSLNLTASGGTTYLWSNGSANSIVSVAPTTTSTYTVTITGSGGCTSTAMRTVSVNPLPLITISPNAPSTCPGVAINLTASGGASYAWSTGATTPTISPAPLVSTAYTVTVTTSSGCSATASRNVVVNFCDIDGDGDPDHTDPSPNNGCLWGTNQQIANSSSIWRVGDCDGDGVTNYNEIVGLDGNILTTSDNTNPLDPCNFNRNHVTVIATSTGDCDGDGVLNKDETNGHDGNPLLTGDNTNALDPCDYNPVDQVLARVSNAWKSIDCDMDGNPNGTDPHPLDPTAQDDAFTAPWGTATNYNILSNDDFLLGLNTTITRVGGTAMGTVILNGATGRITYTPAINEPNTTQTVRYWVCNTPPNPDVCAFATITITIPPAADTDGDGDPDNTDPNPTNGCVWGTNQVLANSTIVWRNGDCDGDGVKNYDEVRGLDGNPATLTDNTNPNDPCDFNLSQVTLVATSLGDCDGDGVTNKDEINGLDGNPLTPADNTDPKNPCDYNIGQQVFANTSAAWRLLDCDKDGNPNNTDPHPLVPTAVDDAYTAPFGSTTSYNILTNDDFLPGGATSIIRTGGDAGGTVSFNPITGLINYTPLSSEPGTIKKVNYKVCNTVPEPDVCANAVVTITIPGYCPTITNSSSVNVNPTTCNGSDGSIRICGLPINGSGYTLYYNKNGVPQTPIANVSANASGCYTLSNLGAAVYTNIQIKYIPGCPDGTNLLSATLTAPAAANISIGNTKNPTSCSGTDGSIAFSGLNSGTLYKLTYRKDGIQQTPVNFTASSAVYTINGLTAGGYTDIQVENNGCVSNPINAVLSDPTTSTINIGGKTDPLSCSANDGSFTISGLVPGTTYTLRYVKDGFTQTPLSFTSNSISFKVDGLVKGDYSNIRVINNGCVSNSISTTLKDPSAAVISILSFNHPSACGKGDGAITIGGLVRGYVYSLKYRRNGIPQPSIRIDATTSSYAITGLFAGNYSHINVNQGGCVSNSLTQELVEPGAFISLGNFSAPTNCGANNGTITISGLISGLSYKLRYVKDGVQQTTTTFVASGTTYSLNGLLAANYTGITVEQGGCLSNAINILLNNPNGPIIDAYSVDPISCVPGNDGYIIITGLAQGLNYTLNYSKNGVPQSQISFVSSKTSYILSGLTTGTYTGISVSQGGCLSNGVAEILNGPIASAAPALSTTSIKNICPFTTGDLDDIFVTNNFGNEFNWHSSGIATGANIISNTYTVSAGTYYAAFYNTITGCYSSVTPVTVVIESCVVPDRDKDGDPDSTDPNPDNPCIWGNNQVVNNAGIEWKNGDCDGDGVTNFHEIAGPDNNPSTTSDNTNPLNPCSLNLLQVTLLATSTGDCDGDGVTNKDEINGLDDNPLSKTDNTDPNNPCDYNEADQVLANTTIAWKAIDCDQDGNNNGSDPHTKVPTAMNDLLNAPVGQPSKINILTNDDFLPGSNTSIFRVGGNAGGTVMFNNLNGEFTYTPLPSEAGTIVTVIYTVCNTNPNPDVCANAVITINVSNTCVKPKLKVLLEGPLVDNGSVGLMTTKLNSLGYLPGQRPSVLLATPTPVGQPYNVQPWNYSGIEGATYDYRIAGKGAKAGYPSNTTDWVLVSLRSGINGNTTVCTKAALLLNDGTVMMVEGFDCCGIDLTQTYYVVVEHRNHLIVMSQVKVPVVNFEITYDFTARQSYMGLLGKGQKLVNGKYVMYAGNGVQSGSTSEINDINVNDRTSWLLNNGTNSSYFKDDFYLDGDVNVQDKNLWLQNIGLFSDVPTNR